MKDKTKPMSKDKAIEIATLLFNARMEATIEYLFKNGPSVRDEDFHYRHGWITVGEHSICREECFGYEPTYDGP